MYMLYVAILLLAPFRQDKYDRLIQSVNQTVEGVALAQFSNICNVLTPAKASFNTVLLTQYCLEYDLL